jgi:hypothetical protein
MNAELLQVCIWLSSLLVALYAVISLAEWAFSWLTRD